MITKEIPYIDITRFEDGFLEAWQNRVLKVSRKAAFIDGDYVRKLEYKLENLCNVNHSICRDRDKFFNFDLWLSQAALVPPHDVFKLNKIKLDLGINDQDIIIGSFARMQKFSDEFLDLVINSLEKNNLTKFMLAGSGDNSLVIKKLSKFIELKRVFVLPEIDTGLYGHCLTLGLDTFPDHSGYSIIEIMAKGIPVFSKNDNHFQALKKDRLEETVFQTNQEFIKILTHFESHTTKYKFYRQKTKGFFERYERNKDYFLVTLENITKEIETRKI